MRWLEISIILENELADPVADLLSNQTERGLLLEPVPAPDHFASPFEHPPGWVRIRAYLADDRGLEEAKKRVETGLWHLSQIAPLPDPSYAWIDEEDWSETWKKNYRPITVGERLLIRPAWIDAKLDGRLEIILDPGMAFGSGTHPTTRLCLEALETEIEPGDSMLDLGCGSGILSIGAAKLGASSIQAYDIDQEAVSAALENIQRNQVDNLVSVELGSLETIQSSAETDNFQADIVVCNILTPILIEFLHSGINSVMASDGVLILSGVMEGQEPELLESAAAVGLEEKNRQTEGDWICLVLKQKSPS